jgi:hypothetical protein
MERGCRIAPDKIIGWTGLRAVWNFSRGWIRKRFGVWIEKIELLYGFLQAFFYIERDPHSRTKIGERGTQLVHVNEATAV